MNLFFKFDKGTSPPAPNWRLYDNNACIKHWFRGNAIKQYNNLKVTRKESYLIRTETTINNPKSLGLQFAPGYILKTL